LCCLSTDTVPDTLVPIGTSDVRAKLVPVCFIPIVAGLCLIYWLLALTLLFVVAWPPILVALSETDIICARIYVVLVSEYLLLGFLFLSWLVALYGLLGFFCVASTRQLVPVRHYG
jgi:hypothetical protein